MIPADEEYRVIGPGAGEHRGEQHDGLGGDAQTEGSQPRDHALGRHQGHTNGDQRQNHCQQVAVDHQQNRQQRHHRGDLDGEYVPVAEVLDVVEGAGRAGGKGLQRATGHGVLHGLNDTFGRGDRRRGGDFANDIDRQQPRLIVLADQDLPQWRCGHEILQGRDVLGFGTQGADQVAVDHLVSRRESFFVGQHDQKDVVGTGLREGLAHLPLAHDRRSVRRQDGGRCPLGQHSQRRKRHGHADRQRYPCPDHQPGPAHDESTDPSEEAPAFDVLGSGVRGYLCRRAGSSHPPIVGDLRGEPPWTASAAYAGSGTDAARIGDIGADPAITGEPPEERTACSGRGLVEPDGYRPVTA